VLGCALQILVATSTLAWGVNTPAHLVVIKVCTCRRPCQRVCCFEAACVHAHWTCHSCVSTSTWRMSSMLGHPHFNTPLACMYERGYGHSRHWMPPLHHQILWTGLNQKTSCVGLKARAAGEVNRRAFLSASCSSFSSAYPSAHPGAYPSAYPSSFPSADPIANLGAETSANPSADPNADPNTDPNADPCPGPCIHNRFMPACLFCALSAVLDALCACMCNSCTQGTEYYDAPTKRYIDFPITDVLQVRGSCYSISLTGRGKHASA